jgi:N-acetylmuramoyl-L-alanine amidase
LNFTNRESWLDVASRENAGSGKSVHDLPNFIQEIAFGEKVNESGELAASVESSLYGSLSQNNANEKDRGIKQAPFVVLIGSSVPTIGSESQTPFIAA